MSWWRFSGKLVPGNDEELTRCIMMGLTDPLAVLTMDDIVKTESCFFAATGITNGSLLKGVRKGVDGKILTHSFIATRTHSQFVEAYH